MALNAVPDEKRSAPPEPGTNRRTVPGVKPATKPNGAPGAKQSKAIPLATIKEIEKWLLKTYSLIGIGLMQFRPIAAEQILASSPACAESVAKLCEQDPRIRKAISAAMVTGVYGAVIAAHLPIVLAVIAESRPIATEEKPVRFDQTVLLGFARMLSTEGAANLLFGEQPEAENDPGE